MGNPRAFLTIHRQEAGYRPVHERIDDFSEVEQTLNSGVRRPPAAWIVAYPSATGPARWVTSNPNGKICYTKAVTKRHITY